MSAIEGSFLFAHKSVGHDNAGSLNKMIKSGLLQTVKKADLTAFFCKARQFEKMCLKNNKASKQEEHIFEVSECVYIDLCKSMLVYT